VNPVAPITVRPAATHGDVQQASQALAHGLEQFGATLRRAQEARAGQRAARVRKWGEGRAALASLAGALQRHLTAVAERGEASRQAHALAADRLVGAFRAAASAAELGRQRLGLALAGGIESVTRLETAARDRTAALTARLAAAAETRDQLERTVRALGRELARVQAAMDRQAANLRRTSVRPSWLAAVRANTAACRAIQAGDLAAAEAGFREALELHPAAEPRLNLALVLVLEGRLAEAADALAQPGGPTLDPDRLRLVEALVALDRSAPDRALEFAEASLRSNPHQPLMHQLAALAALRYSRPAEALRHLEASADRRRAARDRTRPNDLLESIGIRHQGPAGSTAAASSPRPSLPGSRPDTVAADQPL
jgi:hypothetical protein